MEVVNRPLINWADADATSNGMSITKGETLLKTPALQMRWDVISCKRLIRVIEESLKN